MLCEKSQSVTLTMLLLPSQGVADASLQADEISQTCQCTAAFEIVAHVLVVHCRYVLVGACAKPVSLIISMSNCSALFIALINSSFYT